MSVLQFFKIMDDLPSIANSETTLLHSFSLTNLLVIVS